MKPAAPSTSATDARAGRATTSELRHTINAAVGVLFDEPAATASAQRLPALADGAARVRAWLDSVEASIAVAADRHAAAGAGRDAASVLGNDGRRSRRDAEAAADRGRAATVVPELAAALAGGEVTAGHLDALAAATRNLNDAERERFGARAENLLDAAHRESPEQFAHTCKGVASQVADDDGLRHHERLRRARKVARWRDGDGMCHTRLSLDPAADAQVWSAIREAVSLARSRDQADDDRTFDQLQADAVVDLLTRTTGAGGRSAPEVSVLIDLATLLDHSRPREGRQASPGHRSSPGDRDRRICETADGQPVPVETVRRWCCDGDILPIVLDGAGLVVDAGRANRLATPSQRRALRAMYAMCAHPQCTVGFEDCRIHHVDYWKRGGRTDLANLAPVCERHHHLIHEGGWTLSLDADRIATWTRPDHTVAYHGPSVNRFSTTVIATTAGQDVFAADEPSPDRPASEPVTDLRAVRRRAADDTTATSLFDPGGLVERGPPAA